MASDADLARQVGRVQRVSAALEHLRMPSKVGVPRQAGRRGIQSIEIGARVIDALRQAPGPQSLKELAVAARIPTSNCHRYLVSFVRAGFVSQDPATSRYDLGPGLLQAGLAALSRLDAVEIGTNALTRLVDSTGHTGLLAIWADLGPVIVRWMPGRLAIRTTLSTGSRMPLLTSATGRIFLAYLPNRQTARLAAKEMMTGKANAKAIAADIRTRGMARVSGDHIPGLNAIAAPILDLHGEAAAAITLVGLSDGFAPETVTALRIVTREASNMLGWPNTASLGVEEPTET
jgi:DNA-binding IclR family transcriptional regulator